MEPSQGPSWRLHDCWLRPCVHISERGCFGRTCCACTLEAQLRRQFNTESIVAVRAKGDNTSCSSNAGGTASQNLLQVGRRLRCGGCRRVERCPVRAFSPALACVQAAAQPQQPDCYHALRGHDERRAVPAIYGQRARAAAAGHLQAGVYLGTMRQPKALRCANACLTNRCHTIERGRGGERPAPG